VDNLGIEREYELVASTHKDTWSAISPDGKWIAAYADTTYKKVHIWDSRTGILATSLDNHTDEIRSITFSPDSTHLLASFDKTIHVHTFNY